MDADGPPEKLADLPPSNAGVDRDTAERLKIDITQTRGYNHYTRNVIFNPAAPRSTSPSALPRTPLPMTTNGGPQYSSSIPTAPASASSRAASGNPVGLAFYPGTNTLWTAVNERDQLGDDLVPDYITSVRDGGFYGWPYSYMGRIWIRPSVLSVLTWCRRPSFRMFCWCRTRRRSASPSIPVHSLPPSIATARLSRCMGRSIVRSCPAIRLLPFPCATANPPVLPRISFRASLRGTTMRRKRGGAGRLLQLADGSLIVSDDGGICRVTYGRK